MEETSRVQLRIRLDDPRATIAARTILEVDTALRRTLPSLRRDLDENVILQKDPDRIRAAARGLTERKPRAISPDRGGFEIRDATPGSLDFVGEVYGDVVHALTSDTVTARTNFAVLLAIGKGIWRFLVRTFPAEQALASAVDAEPPATTDVAELAPAIEQAVKSGRDVELVAREDSGWIGSTKACVFVNELAENASLARLNSTPTSSDVLIAQ